MYEHLIDVCMPGIQSELMDITCCMWVCVCVCDGIIWLPFALGAFIQIVRKT